MFTELRWLWRPCRSLFSGRLINGIDKFIEGDTEEARATLGAHWAMFFWAFSALVQREVCEGLPIQMASCNFALDSGVICSSLGGWAWCAMCWGKSRAAGSSACHWGTIDARTTWWLGTTWASLLFGFSETSFMARIDPSFLAQQFWRRAFPSAFKQGIFCGIGVQQVEDGQGESSNKVGPWPRDHREEWASSAISLVLARCSCHRSSRAPVSWKRWGAAVEPFERWWSWEPTNNKEIRGAWAYDQQLWLWLSSVS